MLRKTKSNGPVLAFAVSALLALMSPAKAASLQELVTLKSFTTMYGRAIACGLTDAEKIGHQIGHWMDRRFPAGSQDQVAYLPVFIKGVQSSAEEQHSGQSKMSCSSVAAYFESSDYLQSVAR